MKERICPVCQSRELDYRQKMCSECNVINQEFSHDVARHTWIVNNPEKYKASNKKQNDKNISKLRKKRYRENNRELLSRKELERYHRKKKIEGINSGI